MNHFGKHGFGTMEKQFVAQDYAPKSNSLQILKQIKNTKLHPEENV